MDEPQVGSSPAGGEGQTEARATLLRRLLLTHGPLDLEAIRARYDLPADWLAATLAGWAEAREAAHGRLVAGGESELWCDRENLEQAHRRTLALLRREVQPVPLGAFVDFLARWQHVHPAERLPQSGGLRRALQQLRGLPAPALLWERDLLPARVQGFRAADLEALCQSGEAVWVGSGSGRASHLRARFLFRGEGAHYLEPPAADEPPELGDAARRVLAFLRSEGACFTADLERGTGVRGEALAAALLELVSAGLVANDSLRALHELVHLRTADLTGLQKPARSTLEEQLAARWHGPREPRPRGWRLRQARQRAARRLAAAPQWVGRWSLVHRMGIWGTDVAPQEALDRQVRQLLARYGILVRDCLARENVTFRWDELYSYLQILEMRGEVRRGYFVQGLAGAQFALPEALERLRELRSRPASEEPALTVLNAWDPASFAAGPLVGAVQGPDGEALALPRRPSSYVVLREGTPLLIVERRGRALVAPAGVSEADLLVALRAGLEAIAARSGRRRLAVESWNGAPVLGSPAQPLLESIGCYPHDPVMEWPAP